MRQSYLKNAALLTGSDVVLRLAGMGLRIWLANELGGEGMGLYQLVLAVYSLFITLPAAETGRSCWGRGLQDASAAQGTKQMQGAAKRIYRMNLLETLALLTFILALLSLIVDVIRLTVEVMAKFSQMKSDDNKKD